MKGRTVILAGERGVGKSTVCRETIALAQAEGYTCGGLLTLSRSNDALDVLNVHSGRLRRLTLEPDEGPAVPQGRFRFDPETLSWGNAALARATPCDLLVVDEMGPLEIERGEGWTRAFDVLYTGAFRLALVVIRSELVVTAQLRLPVSATTVITVTPDVRSDLPAQFVHMLEREIEA